MNFRISIKSVIAILSMAILIMASSSCSRFGKSKGQSIEFATFIKAYTGGVVSDKSTIRVELASDIPEAMAGTDLKDGVLTFTPSVKGTARWLSGSMIEFIPETGALKPGQSYTGKLRLDKIQKVGDRKFKKFSFNFLVAIKEAVLSLNEITITAASPDRASIEGTISLTEALPLEKVRKMLEYDYPEKARRPMSQPERIRSTIIRDHRPTEGHEGQDVENQPESRRYRIRDRLKAGDQDSGDERFQGTQHREGGSRRPVHRHLFHRGFG